MFFLSIFVWQEHFSNESRPMLDFVSSFCAVSNNNSPDDNDNEVEFAEVI